jgi:hypothetical protein
VKKRIFPQVVYADVNKNPKSDPNVTIGMRDLFSLVYGLKKEGRVVVEGQVVRLADNQ